MENEISTADAMDALRKALKSDDGYAWSWHCNIAMMHYDAMTEAGYIDHHAKHKTANEGARRFMKMCFGVDGYEPKQDT